MRRGTSSDLGVFVKERGAGGSCLGEGNRGSAGRTKEKREKT